jgi:hypothetical protein
MESPYVEIRSKVIIKNDYVVADLNTSRSGKVKVWKHIIRNTLEFFGSTKVKIFFDIAGYIILLTKDRSRMVKT